MKFPGMNTRRMPSASRAAASFVAAFAVLAIGMTAVPQALADCTVKIRNKSTITWTYRLILGAHPNLRYQIRGEPIRTLRPGQTGSFRWEDLSKGKGFNVTKRGTFLTLRLYKGDNAKGDSSVRLYASFNGLAWTHAAGATPNRCFNWYERAPYPASNWSSGYLKKTGWNGRPSIDIIKN